VAIGCKYSRQTIATRLWWQAKNTCSVKVVKGHQDSTEGQKNNKKWLAEKVCYKCLEAYDKISTQGRRRLVLEGYEGDHWIEEWQKRLEQKHSQHFRRTGH